MPKEHILDNMRVIVQDVASHKPAEFGKHFITAVIYIKGFLTQHFFINKKLRSCKYILETG